MTISLTDAFSQLSADTLILTPNDRLARALRQQYHAFIQKPAYATPNIYALKHWLQQQWQMLYWQGKMPYLLNEFQTGAIWQQIISEAGHPLINLPATVNLARQAWQRLQQWQVPLERNLFAAHQDHLHFFNWCQQFEKVCRKKNVLDPDRLSNALLTVVDSHTDWPKTLFIVGFEDIPPVINALLDKLPTDIKTIALPIHHAQCEQLAVATPDDELNHIVDWAWQQWQAGKKAIACVVPDINSQRATLAHAFHQRWSSHAEKPYNLSLGVPLANLPVIRTALQLIQLATLYRMPIETLSEIINSHFIAEYENEKHARALLDVQLRAQGQPYYTTTALFYWLEQTDCPKLQTLLTQWQATEKPKGKLLPSEWLTYFHQLLTSFGWPGEALSVAEQQTVQRWFVLCQDFASLDAVCGKLGLNQAYQWLQRLCQQTIYQPDTSDTPIQILGPLEAASIHFDCLWVMGMTDENWPPAASPNPLLPMALQREHEMPHATANRQLHFCQQLIHRFQQQAEQVIFSYAQTDGDRRLLPSRLIADFPHSQSIAPVTPAIAQTIFAARETETWTDDRAPAVKPDETIRGGSQVVTFQAACPFKAFAACRLQAQSLGEPIIGVDPLTRGSILHEALDHLWQQLGDQATLLKQTETQLQTRIENALDSALAKANHLSSKQRALEKQRQLPLINDWLTAEKDRPPFKVAATEQRIQLAIANLQLNLQIDRIDQLANGTYLIIDYKTGLVSVDEWFSERPLAPQMPLYCLASKQAVSALSFAQIRVDGIGFAGISDEPIDIPGVITLAESASETATDWQQQVKEWRHTITQLIENFTAGHAEVDPRDVQSCQFCEFDSLCRVGAT